MQTVDGRQDVEVGYYVRARLQGNGFATEAATACRDYTATLGGCPHVLVKSVVG
jgi:RimJ/RimL family protein N-acetyltransferase